MSRLVVDYDQGEGRVWKGESKWQILAVMYVSHNLLKMANLAGYPLAMKLTNE